MKIKFLIALIVFLPYYSNSQVTLTTQLPSSGVLLKDQLWNVVITNNSNELRELKMQLDVRDLQMGQSVINASTGKIILGKGLKIITIKDVQPIVYDFVASDFAGNFLPCGSYTINYRLIQETSKGDVPVANEVARVTISPLSPPILATPTNNSIIETSYPQFSWMPPIPVQMFNPLTYDVSVVAIEEGQSAREAMEVNQPVFINSSLQNPSQKLASSFGGLQQGAEYAWQIVAKSGNSCMAVSEIWKFKVSRPSFNTAIVDQASFIQMKKDDIGKGTAVNGILKLSYTSETSESEVTVHVMNGGRQQVGQFTIPVHIGDNLIKYDLKKLPSLKEGVVYNAQIINGRSEKWVLQFEIYHYDKEKYEHNDPK